MNIRKISVKIFAVVIAVAVGLILAQIVYTDRSNWTAIVFGTKQNTGDFFREEFDTAMNAECDVHEFSLMDVCLSKLRQLDVTAKSLKKPVGTRCSECKQGKTAVYYHTFWQIDVDNEKHKRVLMLNIRSFIATQNLCCVKLLLWRLAEFSPSILDELNDAFAAYIKRGVIEIRLFDMATICRGKRTFLAKKPFCKGKKHELKSLIRYKIVGLSDFVRFVVLDLYEGIYVDGDTVFLKDMQLSWHRNFAYRWEHVQSYNTAVLGISRAGNTSSNTLQLLKLISGKCTTFNSCKYHMHPIYLSDLMRSVDIDILDNKLLRMFSSFLFDPAWLCTVGRSKTFISKCIVQISSFHTLEVKPSEFSMKNFFDGSFTYHIHLTALKGPIKPNSYFAHLERYFQSVVAQLSID